jgi:Heterokaryon incompatibility protein (HET)
VLTLLPGLLFFCNCPEGSCVEMDDEQRLGAEPATHVLPEKEVEYEECSNFGRWIAEVTRHQQHLLAKDYWAWKEDRVRARQEIMSDASETTPKVDSASVMRDLPHKYKPFRDPRSIRLFRLFDVDLDAREIIGCFYEETLVQNINSWFEAKGRLYEALSYTWQQPVEGVLEDSTERPWAVIVCQHIAHGRGAESFTASAITLGHNLAAYLKAIINAHVRDQVSLAFEIWIDALCIDQNNAAERQAQIELMGNIYSAATKVHIWLGENTKD